MRTNDPYETLPNFNTKRSECNRGICPFRIRKLFKKTRRRNTVNFEELDGTMSEGFWLRYLPKEFIQGMLQIIEKYMFSRSFGKTFMQERQE